jgi:Holliday junction resolvase RusA-like endonuclease
VRFTVPGIPVAKGRPRFVRAGQFTRAVTPKQTIDFENRVRLSAQAAGIRPLDGPVEVHIRAVWPMKGQPLKRSKRPSSWKPTKPDADNVLKAVLDALNGIAYHDDGQVCVALIHKIHAAQGDPAQTIVSIRPLQGIEG